MFVDQGIGKPQSKSVIITIVATILVFIASMSSPLVGYFLALLTLVMIIVAIQMDSIWPSISKKENSFVFGLFWGLIIGAIVPFLISTYMEGGASAMLEIFTSDP